MRITKKYMLENYPKLERKVELLDLYLFDIQNSRDPDETEIQFNVRGQLFRASSPTGGYVVIYYIPDQGQTGNTQIAYLDDLNRSLAANHSEHTLNLRIVLERLTIARNRAQEATLEVRWWGSIAAIPSVILE
jgi:hypothetical protein